MRRLLLACALALAPPLALAWNAAGHRLVGLIAGQQLTPAGRAFVAETLGRHPDFARWRDKAEAAPDGEAALLAEAATWPDDIRNDPRFYDEMRDAPTPPLPGLPDTARHKRWHYVDLDPAGRAVAGELDRQIERLDRLLRSRRPPEELSHALPWLAHLVGDIHQPLHVGRHGDEGGNQVEIENPFNKRRPFSSLHLYWDDLPGPPWLRGRRLENAAARLLEDHLPPAQGSVATWRDESHRLLASAYPTESGSLLPIVGEAFHQQARRTAERRLVEAGYRLGRLLNAIADDRVSRETADNAPNGRRQPRH